MASRVFRNLLAVSAALVLATVFSCKTFDLPAETCNPSLLHASAPGTEDCGRCLEDHCCDAVGVCERTTGCAGIVSQTQFCVLNQGINGASAEKSCAEGSGLTLTKDKKLVNPEADGTYRCMRGECGAQCGLPVCKVDKAALLIRNARCDECFAGGCCAPLNRCYENRACKLMLECIINTCGSELGKALKDPTGGPPDGSVGSRAETDLLCSDHPPPNIGIPDCVRTCLCRYRDNDQGLPPENDALLPASLAQSVYFCGKDAQCGDRCTPGRDEAGAP